MLQVVRVLLEMIKFNNLVPKLGLIEIGDKKNGPCRNKPKQEPLPFFPEGYPHKLGSTHRKENFDYVSIT